VELTYNRDKEQGRIEITGEIDEEGANALKRQFNEVDLKGLKELVFDFSHVTHIGSAGLGKLLMFYKSLAVEGGKMRIENSSENISELMEELNLNKLFQVS
jgi:anti-sigma B factor antagonist